MLIEDKGFTLVEVLVASVIFFMAMATLSLAFGNASQRLFKLTDWEKETTLISQSISNDEGVEKETQEVEIKISYKDKGERKAVLYSAEVKLWEFSECHKCPKLIGDIRILSREKIE